MEKDFELALERSCDSCKNGDYVHEYEIYLCRREDGCHWEPKGDV